MSRRDERPKLRSDLIAGPHPEDAAKVLVFCPRTGQFFETTADGWALAGGLDGRRTIAEVASTSIDRTDKSIEPEVFERYVARLRKLGALEEKGARSFRPALLDPPQRSVVARPAESPIVVHPDARFSCEGFGTCCESGFVIPLTPPQAVALRRVAHELLPGKPDPLRVVPAETGRPFVHALANERACPFLDEQRRCLVHDRDEQPDPCRVFPIGFTLALDRIHASPTHRCMCGLLARGDRLEDQRAALATRLRHSGLVASVPDQTRLDDHTVVPTRVAIDALLASIDEQKPPFVTLTDLVDRLVELSKPSSARAPARVLLPERLYARLSADLPPWEDEAAHAIISGRPHPQRFQIRRQLALRKIEWTRADARLEAGRFLRDHLFGLGVYDASTWARALLALGVGLHRVLTKLPARSSFAAALERIMLLEEALRSKGFRGLFGAKGPLAARASTLAAVRRQLERFASDVG